MKYIAPRLDANDDQLKVAKLYNMLPTSLDASAEGRTAVENQTVRSVFIVGPDNLVYF